MGKPTAGALTAGVSQGYCGAMRRHLLRLARTGGLFSGTRSGGIPGRAVSQLRMRYPHGTAPNVSLQPAYELRVLRPGDETAWTDLLNLCGQLGAWTLARLRSEMASYYVPDTQFFAVAQDGQLVSGAGVYQRTIVHWEVGWVATLPQHAGRGLGRAVTAAAVAAALKLPSRPICLFTDDHRSAAIKVYLRLGFHPDCHDPSHLDRWHRIIDGLGPAYELYHRAVAGRNRW